MTPDQLSTAQFAGYGAAAKAFAVEFLLLLQRLPLAVCPSFLQQVQALDTSFPAEREGLRWQFQALTAMPQDRFEALMAPLRTLHLPPSLQAVDWVHTPGIFITGLTDFLWSSGAMPQFRVAAQALFAAVPPQQDKTQRLAIVLLGRGATPQPRTVLRKLRKYGVLLTALQQETTLPQIVRAFQDHAEPANSYASWYVDGGLPHPQFQALSMPTVTVSYSALEPLRRRVLERMQATIATGTAGAESMRNRMATISAHDAGATELTADPVLGRFYTELFTLSSGPQVFSTTFVQWTGRELARRAQPRTLLLRYAPRQQHHDLNELFAQPDAGALDPAASLRDAEMGAYLNWIELNRITQPGRLTFAAVVEGSQYAVVVGPGAKAGTSLSSPMSFQAALKTFG